MTDFSIEIFFVGIIQFVTLLIVFHLFEIAEYFLTVLRNTWVQYAFTFDVIIVSLIGSYFYFVMHYYYGDVITVMIVTASLFYFYGTYMRNLWTNNVLIVNSIIFFIVLFSFLENIRKIIRYMNLLFWFSTSILLKLFTK